MEGGGVGGCKTQLAKYISNGFLTVKRLCGVSASSVRQIRNIFCFTARYCVRNGDSVVSMQTSATPKNISGMRSVFDRGGGRRNKWREHIRVKARERIEALLKAIISGFKCQPAPR